MGMRLIEGFDAYVAPVHALEELYPSAALGKEGIIFSLTDVLTWMNLSSTLTDDDLPGFDQLASGTLDA